MNPSKKQGFRLTVDVGNTNTVLGIFRGEELLFRWRFTTQKEQTRDEILLRLQGLMHMDRVKPEKVERIGFASVVPAQDHAWISALERHLKRPVRVLDHGNCADLRLEYPQPQQIGADRLANVLGATHLGHSRGVIVDFGTATTFDVFEDHTYHGGLICPGIRTSLKALASDAARLYEVKLQWPSGTIGKSTEHAIQAGLLFGTVGQVRHLLDAVLEELPMKSPVILATGGLAHFVSQGGKLFDHVEPDLTLMGINYFLSRFDD